MKLKSNMKAWIKDRKSKPVKKAEMTVEEILKVLYADSVRQEMERVAGAYSYEQDTINSFRRNLSRDLYGDGTASAGTNEDVDSTTAEVGAAFSGYAAWTR